MKSSLKKSLSVWRALQEKLQIVHAPWSMTDDVPKQRRGLQLEKAAALTLANVANQQPPKVCSRHFLSCLDK